MKKNASIHKEMTFHIHETREAICSKPHHSLISEAWENTKLFPSSCHAEAAEKNVSSIPTVKQLKTKSYW
jgi:hypothetical protein